MHVHVPRLLRGPKRRTRPGAPPGTLHFDPEASPPTIRVVGFDRSRLEADELDRSTDEAEAWNRDWPVTWFDVTGFGQGEELQILGRLLGLHPLALEDVVNLGQRPKVESYQDHLFVVVRMAHVEHAATEQLSLFFGQGWVLTVQEREGDCFDGVRERLQDSGRRIRSRGSDYLAYALLDAVVDSYFPTLEAIGDGFVDLEEEVLENATPETSHKIHALRRSLIALRKSIVPHRDVLGTLSRDSHPLVGEETQIFLRDVYDHVLRVTDLVETYRELTGDMLSIYMTVVSNRMNEIMKVLTIIASIFIPLSFIAGLYGMNFDPDVSRWNMPELGWRLGYPFALGLMALVGGGFLYMMWRKGWLK